MSSSNKDLKIYNSLTSQKETFSTVNNNSVGMYVCGPTVYNTVHLGNCRTFISFDLIFRYLKHLGYKVRYVRNITDVGHLTEDTDEDKISKRAKIEKIEPMEVVQKYTNEFHSILNSFNLLNPSIEPTATGHIIEQIQMIEKIIGNGFAYESNGSVYFDLINFSKKYKYGELSNRSFDEILNESRSLKGFDEKRNPQDFALWKKAEDKHIMKWLSPWGYGFPGWHIECSAMGHKYLGKKFDIHGGGIDLKFPHHDCEIAQSKSVYGENPANFWVHTNMLTLNGKKMSKSVGNSVFPNEIFDGSNQNFTKAFSPMILKFFMYQAHYRNTLDISNDALLAAEKGFEKIKSLNKDINEILSNKTNDFNVMDWVNDCYQTLNDDFNSPKLIAKLFELHKVVSEIKSSRKNIDSKNLILLKKYFKVFYDEILGLNKNYSKDDNQNELLKLILELRKKERDNKNFDASDYIRDRLIELGINVSDK
jgi:cysteinyl-tRNA synthetase